MILTFRVDFGLGPVEDTEGVVGSEVDERERESAGAGLPGGGFGEEEVADVVFVGGGGWRVDCDEVEIGRGLDTGPPEGDGIAGFREGGWGDGEGGFRLGEGGGEG